MEEKDNRYQGLAPDTTLKQAKGWLRQRVIVEKKAQRCPCCLGMNKVYKRKITTTAAVGLLTLYRHFPHGEFVSKTDIAKKAKGIALNFGGGDFSKCRFFSLIIEKPKDFDDDKRSSGYWALTDQGRAFCKKELKLSKYALEFRSKVLGFEGPLLSIEECLGDEGNFSYAEIMGKVAP